MHPCIYLHVSVLKIQEISSKAKMYQTVLEMISKKRVHPTSSMAFAASVIVKFTLWPKTYEGYSALHTQCV